MTMHYIGLENVSTKTGGKPKIVVRMFFDQNINYEMAVKDVPLTHTANYCSYCRYN
jgi:hypothetical protein